ncbi:MAG TPA: TIR domain-containing protein [Steroidobacteraceae bacterium]|nr:TIR domain-containing protein [Steroidobacteraceae bacterium]
MTEPSRAVFLSYTAQDMQTARTIFDALQAAGIEVWFDRSQLRGGDAWDQKIRREIQECALFIPVISSNTAARREGYFRLEWDLADQRTHMMARNRAFIVPVCVDTTPETIADVPESFQRAHWTRLPAGAATPEFTEHIRRLLAADSTTAPLGPAEFQPGLPGATSGRRFGAVSRRSVLLGSVAAVLVAVLAYLGIGRLRSLPSAAVARFAPPPHSIAVLPFANLSGDSKQEYFSEGLTEEVLNSLAQITQLQIAGRTSSFYFKGKDVDLGTIARKLNVADVLEGSVRRSAGTIRVTAQLTNTVTGYEVWSKTYDRDAGDVLKLQTEIATAVADALKVTLLGDVAARIELGGTRNPAAFDTYLRASRTYQLRHETGDIPAAVALYSQAIDLDPNYALAFAGRSLALSTYGAEVATETAKRESFTRAEADAREAIALAPQLAEAHLALANVYNDGPLDFGQAGVEYRRALALGSGSARVLSNAGGNAAYMGHFDVAIAATRRAVVLDPLNRSSHTGFGLALYLARRYQEAAAAYAEAISLNPDFAPAYAERGLALYGQGDLQGARASCEAKRDFWYDQQCLAVVYEKLGRHAEAEAELKKIQAAAGDAAAYQYASILAQWGDHEKALEWLDAAFRMRDPGLMALKTDPLLDPLHPEPRFQAMLQALGFSN